MASLSKSDQDVGFQIAPMIDLILVLLVFFMSTVAMKRAELELGISLSGTQPRMDDSVVAAEPLQLNIDSSGSVVLNSELVGKTGDPELLELKKKLSEQLDLFGNKTSVIINPEPDVPQGRVIDVLNACVGARIKNITFGG